MIIKLSPQVSTKTLSVSRNNDIFTINGEIFDFTPLSEGAILPADAINCDYIFEPVKRVNGELEITFLFPISSEASEEALFPQPIINPPQGEIVFPR